MLATLGCGPSSGGPLGEGGGGGDAPNSGGGEAVCPETGEPCGPDGCVAAPADVTVPESCTFCGQGGDNPYANVVLQLDLSERLPAEGLTGRVSSDEETFELSTSLFDGDDCYTFATIGTIDGVESVALYATCVGEHRFHPTEVSVALERDGMPVGSGTFSNLTYACIAAKSDEWVWAATESLMLEITGAGTP